MRNAGTVSFHPKMTALLSGFKGYALKSNRESGDGRPDLLLMEKRKRELAIIIEVKDTSVWNSVCEDFHISSLSKIPEELRELYFSDHTFAYKIDKDSAFTKESGPYIKRLIVYSRKNMTVCVFHSLNDKQYDAILDKELENIIY